MLHAAGVERDEITGVRVRRDACTCRGACQGLCGWLPVCMCLQATAAATPVGRHLQARLAPSPWERLTAACCAGPTPTGAEACAGQEHSARSRHREPHPRHASCCRKGAWGLCGWPIDQWCHHVGTLTDGGGAEGLYSPRCTVHSATPGPLARTCVGALAWTSLLLACQSSALSRAATTQQR